MKTKNENLSKSRSENAQNEKRDSHGRFESGKSSSRSTTHSNTCDTSKSTSHRGENTKNEKRDENGQFTSGSGSRKK